MILSALGLYSLLLPGSPPPLYPTQRHSTSAFSHIRPLLLLRLTYLKLHNSVRNPGRIPAESCSQSPSPLLPNRDPFPSSSSISSLCHDADGQVLVNGALKDLPKELQKPRHVKARMMQARCLSYVDLRFRIAMAPNSGKVSISS